MRIAVVGATGLVGTPTVSALQHGGHVVVPVSRSTGVDLSTGEGLDAALAGVDAVVDVTNTLAADPADAESFFASATGNLLAAEERARVRHHVVVSIVGLDRIRGNGHYHGKRRRRPAGRHPLGAELAGRSVRRGGCRPGAPPGADGAAGVHDVRLLARRRRHPRAARIGPREDSC
ncbi:MAG TPA: hypothetical protein VI357_05600 [Mycobacteriales bacterium]